MGAITEKAPSPFGACELVLTAPEPVAPKRRDYAAERAAAKLRQSEKIAKVMQLRHENVLGREMFQMSQAFIACSVMPYSPTTERQIGHTARLADSTLTVTLTAGLKGVALPFGADRTVLYLIFDEAVKTNSRFISRDSIGAMLKDLGMADSGQNRTLLEARLERLAGAVIGVQRSNETSNLADTKITRMFSRTLLPKRAGVADKHPPEIVPVEYRGKTGMLLSEEVFADLQKYHVAVPTEVIKMLRNQPQMLDISLFLYWRSFAAQSESFITWDALREQLGHSDSNPRRLRETTKSACEMWKTIWPEFNCGTNCEGLVIRPPRRGVQLLKSEGQKARNLTLALE